MSRPRPRRRKPRPGEYTYNAGADLTFALVKEWLIVNDGHAERPRFAFPPKEYALIADLRDIGKRLARNDSASRLVDRLIEETVKITGAAPTAMMLRIVLETLEQPIEWVSLSELGLAVGTS